VAPQGRLVPCDAAGKFSEDCEVLFDDGAFEEMEQGFDEDMKEEDVIEAPHAKGTQQHFDVYLTRVEIGKF